MNTPFNFKWLKSQINIQQLLCAYQLDGNLKPKNDSLYGPCPIHQGDNPTAFRVDLNKNVWHCFTHCGGGDIVELVRKIENCSYQQVARSLQRLVDHSHTHNRPLPHTFSSKSFVPFSHKLLLDPNTPFLQKQKNISVNSALFYEAGIAAHSRFLQNMVAVRLYDLNANPIGYCGRRLLPQDIEKWGKWRFPQHLPKSSILFNAHRAQPYRQNGIILVECPWAAIRFAQAGVKNTVALLGTSLSPLQVQWISTSPVALIILDNDPAGQKAAKLIASVLQNSTKTIIHQLSDVLEPEDLSDEQIRSIAMHYSFF